MIYLWVYIFKLFNFLNLVIKESILHLKQLVRLLRHRRSPGALWHSCPWLDGEKHLVNWAIAQWFLNDRNMRNIWRRSPTKRQSDWLVPRVVSAELGVPEHCSLPDPVSKWNELGFPSRVLPDLKTNPWCEERAVGWARWRHRPSSTIIPWRTLSSRRHLSCRRLSAEEVKVHASSLQP